MSEVAEKGGRPAEEAAAAAEEGVMLGVLGAKREIESLGLEPRKS